MSTPSLLLLGLVLGARHATDPDHVAAVTTIVAGERSLARASRIGALWGLGHTVTILIAGGAIVGFRYVVPPRVGLAAELLVAFMLIVLGALALRRPAHDHESANVVARPIMVGLVHGLAGSAFVAMLVLAAAPTVWVAMGYLAVFGAGTVIGMASITAGLAYPTAMVMRRFRSTPRVLQLASGVASIAIGLMLVHRVGFVDGLFTAAPHWIPQ